jgi:hypothetical protein
MKRRAREEESADIQFTAATLPIGNMENTRPRRT